MLSGINWRSRARLILSLRSKRPPRMRSLPMPAHIEARGLPLWGLGGLPFGGRGSNPAQSPARAVRSAHVAASRACSSKGAIISDQLRGGRRSDVAPLPKRAAAAAAVPTWRPVWLARCPASDGAPGVPCRRHPCLARPPGRRWRALPAGLARSPYGRTVRKDREGLAANCTWPQVAVRMIAGRAICNAIELAPVEKNIGNASAKTV